MKELLQILKKSRERLQNKIDRLDAQIESVEAGNAVGINFTSKNACFYMKKCSSCGKNNGYNIHKIKCLNENVPGDFMETRTDWKCSLPLGNEKEPQFCKYYKKRQIK